MPPSSERSRCTAASGGFVAFVARAADFARAASALRLLVIKETSVPTRRDVLATASLALIAGARRMRAQDGLPQRPIRILVGYPAGGGVDIVARLFAEPMKAALGQSVIVENRAGASGMIAAAAVAKAPPDGLTMLMAASGEVAINQHLYKDKMSYDPPRELV